MNLPQSKYTFSAAVEEVHIFAESCLPQYGEIFSVLPSCPDSGVAFTVNTCGVSGFILNNTSSITITINTLLSPVNAFCATHLTVRAPRAAYSGKRSTRSLEFCSAKVRLHSCGVLRL